MGWLGRFFLTRRWFWAAALLLGCALSTQATATPLSKTSDQKAGASLVIQDDVGRTRRISFPVKRVVALSGFAAEVICSLGVGGRVVGRSEWVTWPPSMKKTPSVGSLSQPNLELLASLRPDVIIADLHFAGAASGMESVGAPVIFLQGYDINDIGPPINKLGRIFDRQKQAEKLISFTQNILKLVKDRLNGLAKKNKPKVFYGFGQEVFFTYSNKGRQPHLMLLAGGKNVAASLPAVVALVSPEWLVMQNPNIAVISARLRSIGFQVAKRPHMAALWHNLAGRPGLRGLECARNGNLHLINSRLVYGPRAVIGLLYLAKWFHPDRFADVNPEKIHAAFLSEFYNLPLKGAYVYP